MHTAGLSDSVLDFPDTVPEALAAITSRQTRQAIG